MKLLQTNTYLLLIDEEVEIRVNNLFYPMDGKGHITRRSSMYLNVDGCGKIIAYRKLNEEAKELEGLPLLPPFEEVVDVKYLALNHIEKTIGINPKDERWDEVAITFKNMFIAGYKAAQQSNKQFSLGDVIRAYDEGTNSGALYESLCGEHDSYEEMEEAEKYIKQERDEFIQSLSTQQLPKEFKPIMYPKYTQYDGFEEDDEIPVMTPMTFTNSEGKKELIGTYKY